MIRPFMVLAAALAALALGEHASARMPRQTMRVAPGMRWQHVQVSLQAQERSAAAALPASRAGALPREQVAAAARLGDCSPDPSSSAPTAPSRMASELAAPQAAGLAAVQLAETRRQEREDAWQALSALASAQAASPGALVDPAEADPALPPGGIMTPAPQQGRGNTALKFLHLGAGWQGRAAVPRGDG
jgi:hypothetical protein